MPAMFSTSVLERRKSLDPGQLVDHLEKTGRQVLGLLDKENRPPEVVKAKDLGDWWLQQRHKDELQQQQTLEERRMSRSGAGRWQRRCEELEAESKAQAEELYQLKDQLRREEEQRKAQAERFQLILKGSEAVDRLAGLQQLQEQMQKLKEKSSMQEEQLEALTRRRNAKDPEQHSLSTQTDAMESEAVVVQQLQEELNVLKAETDVRTKCYRQVQEDLQRDCDLWQRKALALETVPKAEGCNACETLLAEGRQLNSTVALLKEQCEGLEVENQSLKSKVESLQENLEYVSSSHAELAGHANHRQKIRHTLQLKTDRDATREENFRLKQRIRQLEAGRSSQGIIQAVAGWSGGGATPDAKTPARHAKSGFRQPRFSGLETRDAKERMKIQQLEQQLERNRNNVMHFLVLIERAVANGRDDSGDAAGLLAALRSRFLS